MKIILLWLRVQSAENSASAILANVVKDQYTFKLRTAAPTMSTTWFTHGVVTPVTAALTNPVTNDLSVKPRYCVTAVRLLSLVFCFLCDYLQARTPNNQLELEKEFTYHGSFLNQRQYYIMG